jgi:hypothetical protein
VRYVKTGPEDYAQAEAYCLTAIELYWRNVGLGVVSNATPTPLADIDPYLAGDVDAEDVPLGMSGEPTYRDPFA